jgi:branched-chain amino acid transport system substrate-binding protein
MATGALKIADKKGTLDGPAIKAALETFKNWSPFDTPNALGRTPVTFTATDHRPSSVSLLYIIKGGKIEPLAKIDMKERFPKEWESWLGW